MSSGPRAIPAGLVVLVGPPAAGKTAFVREVVAQGSLDPEAVVSSDDIRAEFFGAEAADALILEGARRNLITDHCLPRCRRARARWGGHGGEGAGRGLEGLRDRPLRLRERGQVGVVDDGTSGTPGAFGLFVHQHPHP
ncbi:AAA family ATPase [Streptomyces sp. NBC_00654]|uniref:AAA family ATPase n=1 Tax=Streptomyces sp. NBC_00654 TaxID=2975799 RepID=UPI002B1E0F29|nr:AAA family ATPase [Streptomyces sp. NBC_00654]